MIGGKYFGPESPQMIFWICKALLNCYQDGEFQPI